MLALLSPSCTFLFLYPVGSLAVFYTVIMSWWSLAGSTSGLWTLPSSCTVEVLQYGILHCEKLPEIVIEQAPRRVKVILIVLESIEAISKGPIDLLACE